MRKYACFVALHITNAFLQPKTHISNTELQSHTWARYQFGEQGNNTAGKAAGLPIKSSDMFLCSLTCMHPQSIPYNMAKSWISVLCVFAVLAIVRASGFQSESMTVTINTDVKQNGVIMPSIVIKAVRKSFLIICFFQFFCFKINLSLFFCEFAWI